MLNDVVQGGSPIFLPWCRANVFLGNGFDSQLLKGNELPWKGRTALRDVYFASKVAELSTGAASYREGESDSSRSDSSHLSASFGATVGCDFLNANVTGLYDRMILNSTKGSRTSRHCSYTAGYVTFEEPPSLDTEALQLLKTNPNGFHQDFGDYYVDGLQIGANAGMSLICEESSHDQKESTEISVTAHVLLWDKTVKHSEQHADSKYDMDLSFCGYNTMREAFEIKQCAAGHVASEVFEQAGAYAAQIQELQATTDERLAKMGLGDGEHLSWAQIGTIATSGLVSHVILRPYSQLPDVVPNYIHPPSGI